MKKDGQAILRAHDQNVQSVVKGGARKCLIYISNTLGASVCGNFDGLAANCPPHLTSDVGHDLADQSGTFGLCWFLDKDNKCRCSLRSNGDYDVSVIAKAFGGGGHRNAAGFETDIQILIGWLK
jgi:nanoRNase/pAp phosphatase (c-di-AMP/oligoRNAs hydrolase)